MDKLAENVTKYRKEKGWSIQELHRRSKVSASIISDIERGIKTSPELKTLDKIATALSVTVKKLLS